LHAAGFLQNTGNECLAKLTYGLVHRTRGQESL
jgi:hypothetical protein